MSEIDLPIDQNDEKYQPPIVEYIPEEPKLFSVDQNL